MISLESISVDTKAGVGKLTLAEAEWDAHECRNSDYSSI